MSRGDDVEMRWIDAWNDLFDIASEISGGQGDIPCQLPDWSIVDVEQCKGWLQASAYLGYRVRIEPGWVGHRRGAIAHRWRQGDS